MILAFAAMTFAACSDPFEDDGTNGESTSTGVSVLESINTNIAPALQALQFRAVLQALEILRSGNAPALKKYI